MSLLLFPNEEENVKNNFCVLLSLTDEKLKTAQRRLATQIKGRLSKPSYKPWNAAQPVRNLFLQ